MSDPSLDVQNRSVYRHPDQVEWYGARAEIHPGERALFERFQGDLAGRRILDIGVGGGRTVPALSALASEYVGIDYAPELVDRAKERFPDVRIECCDARDLSAYGVESFDAVLFTFNGIDYVAHEDRLRALAEIRQVIAPGGLFLFSSHNRDHARAGRLPWQGRRIGRAMLRESTAALVHWRRRRRLRSRTVETEKYALLNDDAHGYSLITYYIRPADQIEQLTAAGFTRVSVFDQLGQPMHGTDSHSMWLYYASYVPERQGDVLAES